MEKYNHKKIEAKWQKYWAENKLYQTSEDKDKPKYYILDMFPYPSGAGLHVGHPKGYIATDIFARAKMMQGYNVLHPMGWDAFGLPAENYAIANKIHPRLATEKNIATFKRQLGLLGFTYDWDREINTTDPEFYKWTQWTFIKMFERGLAYESNEPVNWCPDCKTVLSNEDLENGLCERCGSQVEQRPMRQWVLKITDYAERMLNDLEKLPLWEESIKEMQRNWIGRSEGAEIEFEIMSGAAGKFDKKVLIGTRNEAKISMIRACLKGISGINLISLNDLPPIDDSDLIEGDDCIANAKLKSEYYFKKTGLPTISTDHIFWIEKWPKNEGIINHIRKLANSKSSRATDKKVIDFLLKFLKKAGGSSRAHFIYAISYTDQFGTTAAKQIPREYVLQTERSKDFWPGYPIESMLKDAETGIFKSEQKDEIRYAKVVQLFKETFVSKITGIEKVKVFTTRPDTLFGATYFVLSPEHLLVEKITSREQKKAVKEYIKKSAKKSDLERTELQKEKTGVFTGAYAKNPVNQEMIPVWIADYVLMSYGTGAIMAVPAHDQRDFEFAKKYNIEIKHVLKPGVRYVFKNKDQDIKIVEKKYEPFFDFNVRVIKSGSYFYLFIPGDFDSVPSPEDEGLKYENFTNDIFFYSQDDQLFELSWGIIINSGKYNGMFSLDAGKKIVKDLKSHGKAKFAVNYKIKDWVFSRQRYWGEPIPIVHCQACKDKKYKYLLLHGRHGSSQKDFFPWLKKELEVLGHEVYCPDLPDTEDPKVAEQADFVIKNYKIDNDTIIVAHSLGGAVAFNLLEKANKKVVRVVLIDTLIYPKFNDKKRPDLEKNFHWKFDFEKIKKLSDEFIDLADSNFPIITKEQFIEKNELLNTRLIYVKPSNNHFNSDVEPAVLKYALMDGVNTVPENELPLKLPEVENYEPTGTGESPLANVKEWVNTICPKCGGPAKRETNTMPQWAGSSWYFLRFIDPRNNEALVDKAKDKYWSPVDFYVGGAEHATRHLIYARFWHKFLYDIGAVNYDEPFTRLQHVGLILAEDGRKMSKRWHNVINPDEIVEKFGADAMRVYEMFMGPFSQPCAWSTNGLIGARRFLENVYKLKDKKLYDCKGGDCKIKESGLPQILHKTIKKITQDIEKVHYNTAIAQMMIFVNFAAKLDSMPRAALEKFLILLAPFAPHLAEELWAEIKSPLPPFAKGGSNSIFKQNWPKFNPDLVKDEKINLVIQVNGKVRESIEVSADISEEEAKKIAMENEKIKKWTQGRKVAKVIFVKGKLVNIVVQ